MKTIDVYVGGLYTFAKINQNYTPYIATDYGKVKGRWYKSYYGGAGTAGYGESGKTKVNGHYVSAKVGMNFNKHYSLELEHAKHKLHADAFRSFNINGSDTEFNRTSLNFIYNF